MESENQSPYSNVRNWEAFATEFYRPGSSPVPPPFLSSPSTTRPHSILELSSFAKDDSLPTSRSIAQWINLADTIRRQGNLAHRDGDYQGAFLFWSRVVIHILEKIPNHPTFHNLKSTQRTSLQENGRALLRDVEELKPVLTVRYEQWKGKNSGQAQMSSQLQRVYGAVMELEVMLPALSPDTYGQAAAKENIGSDPSTSKPGESIPTTGDQPETSLPLTFANLQRHHLSFPEENSPSSPSPTSTAFNIFGYQFSPPFEIPPLVTLGLSGEAPDISSDNVSLSLEQLMENHVPVDLTRAVVVDDFRKAAYGGFAVVYKGRWKSHLVAVKMLKATKNPHNPATWEASMERRLMREIRVWAALSHPNIVDFLGYANDFGDFTAMISTWCHHGTANEFLSNNRQLDGNVRFRLVQEVTNGIAYLHALKIIHGDLKPTNILIDHNFVARLCDFGLVRLDDWQGPAGMTTTSPYTGTERYKAPELFISIDNRHPMSTYEGDIYALGCIAHEFVYSRPPYAEYRSAFELQRVISNRDPPASRPNESKNSADFSEYFWDLLEACWDWDPNNRPSVDEVVHALTYLSSLPIVEA